MTNGNQIAIVTGDLVDSAALGADRITIAFHALQNCAAEQAAWMGAPLHFSRHRGDGWQVALARPERALRSILAFRAALRVRGRIYDSYFSIAVGVAPDGLAADLNTHTQEVFIRSGNGLEKLKSGRAIARMAHDGAGPLAAATILADALSRPWTPAQAAAILPALVPAAAATQSEIADRLGKSRQAVTKALRAGGMDYLSLALKTLEGAA